MKHLLFAIAWLFAIPSCLTAQVTKKSDELIAPQEVDYRDLAFYPKRWEAEKAEFDMLAWEGNSVVFLTKKGQYAPELMTQFVQRLDQGWDTYADFIGKQPRRFKEIDRKPTICAIPKNNLSCGYGCGYVGSTGIEASAFYTIDLPKFQENQDSFQHYYFYEMGRNYFVFGNRHSLFTTGYAVFMRYVCMDKLECVDTDQATRKTIERCEEIYANSDLDFYETFTNLGKGEKNNRLKNEKGQVISPSDQPVMYATAMLKLRKDFGDDWVKSFYHRLHECKKRKATDIETAKLQCYNWLVCASAAAEKDLVEIFSDRWRMPLADKQRKLMAKTNWQDEKLDVAEVVDLLLDE